ncbi:MAG: hypothetical protein ACOCUF_01265 [Patescibacteria group bacterium]
MSVRLKGVLEFSSLAEIIRDMLERVGCGSYNLSEYCCKKDFKKRWIIKSFDGSFFQIEKRDLDNLKFQLEKMRDKNIFCAKLEGIPVEFECLPSKGRKIKRAVKVRVARDFYLKNKNRREICEMSSEINQECNQACN